MFKKLTSRLLLASSLFVFSIAQPLWAADKLAEPTVSSTEVLEKININNASNEQLASIKGIGNSKAQAIVDYRQKNGHFTRLEELVNVKGIGPNTFEKIQPFITL